MKRQLSGFHYRFPVFSLFAPSVMHLACASHSSMGWTGGILYIVCIPKTSAHFSVLQASRIMNDVCETAVYKEGRKDVRSQSEHNCICVQTSYMFRLYTGCNRRNGPDFGRVFLMLNYTEKPQNTYIQS